jgi:hypothetical protein
MVREGGDRLVVEGLPKSQRERALAFVHDPVFDPACSQRRPALSFVVGSIGVAPFSSPMMSWLGGRLHCRGRSHQRLADQTQTQINCNMRLKANSTSSVPAVPRHRCRKPGGTGLRLALRAMAVSTTHRHNGRAARRGATQDRMDACGGGRRPWPRGGNRNCSGVIGGMQMGCMILCASTSLSNWRRTMR